MKNEAMIYIHIPFCIKKCEYCDFLSFPFDEKSKDDYLQALLREIKNHKWAQKNISVPSIFFGGGTPSLLSGEEIIELMNAIRINFQLSDSCEITMECNPGTVDREKLCGYQKAGVNRISFGLQSSNDIELKRLGRIHNYAVFLESYKLAREAGFTNINIDLMSALPGQTRQTYQQTLEKVCELSPEHISAYSLIIEENTPFYEQYAQDVQKQIKGERPEFLPDEDTERMMYQFTQEFLKENGYYRYEISNYAKKGYECRHNKGYWTGKNYIGFGLGASSLLVDTRIKNPVIMEAYKNKQLGEQQILTRKDQMEEFMFLGLRLSEGISELDFFEQFNINIHLIYGKVLKKLEKEGMIRLNQDFVKLTNRGVDLSNYVFSEFLLEEEHKTVTTEEE